MTSIDFVHLFSYSNEILSSKLNSCYLNNKLIIILNKLIIFNISYFISKV